MEETGTTLEGFLRTGQMGPISLGMTPGEVETILGEPQARSAKLNPLLLKYDGVELVFWTQNGPLGSNLRQITVNLSEPLPDALRPTDLTIGPAITEDAFGKFLMTRNLAPVRVIRGESEQHVIMPSGVRVSFANRKLRRIEFSGRQSDDNRALPLTDDREPSIDQIRSYLGDARRAARSGLESAAVVLAWAALEASLRRAAIASGLKGRIGVQPTALVRQLAAHKLLDTETVHFLEVTRQLRTELVHGLRPKKIPAGITDRIADIAESLLPQDTHAE